MTRIVQTEEERKRRKAARMKLYYQRTRELHDRRSKQWKITNPVGVLIHSAKGRAQERGLPFDLTEDDLILPHVCPALGIPLKSCRSGDRSPQHGSPTLDRFVPERGYVKGNVAIISHLANTIKNSATTEQVEAVARWMRETEARRKAEMN